MVDMGIRDEINALLKAIEKQYGVEIIYAIESGSRAWGFASKDSDYDIRFIYRNSLDWYVSAFQKKTTIELPMKGDLDAGGWDISKVVSLLYKGNAVIHEWLGSPIVYKDQETQVFELRTFAQSHFNRAAAYYHYLSLAKKKLLTEETRLNAKAFLYGLRSLLCAQWILDESNAPPVLFSTLIDRYVDKNFAESDALKGVLIKKLDADEKASYRIPDCLWKFAAEKLDVLAQSKLSSKREGDPSEYDQLFHRLLGVEHFS